MFRPNCSRSFRSGRAGWAPSQETVDHGRSTRRSCSLDHQQSQCSHPVLITDAESQTTSYTYDDAGQKLTEQYPDHTGGSPGSSSYGIVTFTNDAAGRVLRKQDQLGDTVTYNYDLAGRLTSRDYRTRVNSPSGTIADSDTFTYDKASRMLTAVSGRYSNTVTYAYDDGGRKSSESLTIAGQTYTTLTSYDDKGQLTDFTYPDGTSVERTYTDRGQLHQLKHAGTTIDTRTYDNGGRMTGSSYNNGVSETRAYNTDNTLASISYSGASIGNMSYSWDDNKNKTGETITGTMSAYGFSVPSSGYDDEDRLVTYNRTDGNLDQSWSLSAVGDWNSITTEGTAQSRAHGPTHELTAVAGNSVSTDVKGNITLIPSAARPTSSGLALEWDFDNRLINATLGSPLGGGYIFPTAPTISHEYDALGRRVARTSGGSTTVYVQSGQQTIADYASGATSSAPTFRYVYGSYIDEPVLRYQPTGAQSVYYHRNQQYSITALTNASGTILERYAYTAYGTPTVTNGAGTVLISSTLNNRYTYTGREWDKEIGLHHYRARVYDAELGRFCSRDPAGYVDGSLLYRYVKNQALHLVDPEGKCGIGAGIGGGLGFVSTLLTSWINGESPCQIGCKSVLNGLNGALWGCLGTSGLPPCVTAVLASVSGAAIGTLCDGVYSGCHPTGPELACNVLGGLVGGLSACAVSLGGTAHGAPPGVIAGLEAAIGAILGDDAVKLCNFAKN